MTQNVIYKKGNSFTNYCFFVITTCTREDWPTFHLTSSLLIVWICEIKYWKCFWMLRKELHMFTNAINLLNRRRRVHQDERLGNNHWFVSFVSMFSLFVARSSLDLDLNSRSNRYRGIRIIGYWDVGPICRKESETPMRILCTCCRRGSIIDYSDMMKFIDMYFPPTVVLCGLFGKHWLEGSERKISLVHLDTDWCDCILTIIIETDDPTKHMKLLW